MPDNQEQPAPKFHQGDPAILLLFNKSWRAIVTQYRGYHTDSKGRSDHYYKVVFRDTAFSKERRFDAPERWLLPVQGESHANK